MGEVTKPMMLDQTGQEMVEKLGLIATNITISKQIQQAVAEIQSKLSVIEKMVNEVGNDGFFVADSDGNVAMKYDNSGFDVAKISSHLQTLIKEIEGLGLELGETSTSAYAGDKGKANADAIASHNEMLQSLSSITSELSNKTQQLSTELATLSRGIANYNSVFSKIEDSGFAVTDEEGNIGMKYDEQGFDAAKVSEHFKSLLTGIPSDGGGNTVADSMLNELQVKEAGIFYIDSELNVGAKIDSKGFHAINLIEYKLVND